MAKFDFEIPADFIKQLGKAADLEKYAPVMIDEAMPVLAKTLINGMRKHKDTGAMIDSVKKTKAKKTKYGGYYAVVRPTGKDAKGVRNMEKLMHIEFGTSKDSKSHQSAMPILSKAVKDAEPEVLEKMQEVFNREALGE